MISGWAPYPMVRLTVPFAAGIWWGSLQEAWPSWLTLALALLLLLPGLRATMRSPAWFGVCWSLWMFLAGWAWVRHADPLTRRDHWLKSEHAPQADTRWEGRVRDIRSSDNWVRLRVALDRWMPDKDHGLQPVSGHLLVYLPAADAPDRIFPGDPIALRGKPRPIAPPLDPRGFDWRFYQRVRGVTHQVFLYDRDWRIDAPATPTLYGRFQRWRLRFREILDGHLQQPESRQLARAIILGDRDEFSDALNEAYQASGAVHVLAVSGLHVGLVAGMVMGLLGLFLRRKRQFPLRAILATALVWAYIALTGAADSAVRAGVLFSVILLGRSLSRQAASLNLLATAVFLLLLVSPWMIHHIGFQLSVFAVGGILFFQPMIYRAWYPPDRLSAWAWSLFAVTLAAQLGTLMLSLFHFHRFPVYFLLSGLFVVPLASLFLSVGVATLALHHLSPDLAAWAGRLLEFLAEWMNALVLGISNLPGAVVADLFPYGYWSWLLPLIAGLVLYAWSRKHGASLVSAAMALAAGMLLQAGLMVRDTSGTDWRLLRRQDESTRLLIRQGSDLLALDFQGEQSEPGLEHWPGWGRVWMLPASLDFQYGQVRKQGQRLDLGQTVLTWGPGAGGAHRHLCLPEIPLPAEAPDSTLLLLLPELDARARGRLRRQAARQGLAAIDLREHGCWQESFIPESPERQ